MIVRVASSGSPRWFATQTPGLESTFKQSAARSLTSLAWSNLLGAARRREPFPEWLDAFVADRGLEDRWGMTSTQLGLSGGHGAAPMRHA